MVAGAAGVAGDPGVLLYGAAVVVGFDGLYGAYAGGALDGSVYDALYG